MIISNFGLRSLLLLALLTAHCSLLTAQQPRYFRRDNGAPLDPCTVGKTADTYADSATGKQYKCKSNDGNPSTSGAWVEVNAVGLVSEVNVQGFAASGATSRATVSNVITTLSSGASSGDTSIVVASAASFSVGDYLTVSNGGPGSGEYQGRITNIASNTFTIAPALKTNVASGGRVAHADASVRTTATITASATTVKPADASSFSAGQGIAIPGAGASGGWYIGTISSIAGGVLTITPAISTTVTNGWIMHDDTLAIRAAREAGGKQASLFFPAGIYNMNAGSEGAGAGKGRLITQTVNASTSEWASLILRGPTQPIPWYGTVGGPYAAPQHGAILKTSLAGDALIGGSNTAGDDFTASTLRIEDLELRTYDNPHTTAVNAGLLAGLAIYRTTIDTGFSNMQATQPTLSTARGIDTPHNNNGAYTVLMDVNVVGYHTGATGNEHFTANNLNVETAVRGLDIQTGNHSMMIGRLGVQNVNYPIFVTGAGYVTISELDVEHAASGWWQTTADIYDPSNLARGFVNWHAVTANVGPTATFTVTGGAGLKILSIDNPLDTTLARKAAGVLEVNNAVKVIPLRVATLPTCNAGAEGTMSAVTDSNINTWGATVVGGGANHVLAYCNGTNWTVFAK